MTYENIRAALSAALLLVSISAFGAPASFGTATIHISASAGVDAAEAVRKAIESAPRTGLRLVFEKGVYNFYPSSAHGEYRAVTNHGNGDKYIAMNLSGLDDVVVEGNGSEFIFHGRMMPVLIDDSSEVTLRNFSIDWQVPFFVQGEVVAADEDARSYDLRMYTEGYSWRIEGGFLRFPAEGDFSYSSVGESLVFDPGTHGPIYGSGMLDIHRRTDVRAEKLSGDTVRIVESRPLKAVPPVGSVMTFKGPMNENRYAPAIHCIGSRNVTVENVNVYHALGMGFLGEKSEDITLRNFNVCVREGSDRMVSATADATHFCNCRGDVLIEGCLFENMLDDGTNVHGTYMVVDAVTGPRTIRAKLQHFQQSEFTFGDTGDKVWFILSPDTSRGGENTIESYRRINEFYAEITLTEDLPRGIKAGDLVENKSWNTDSFILRGCTMRNHRARNIVLKAPGRVVIENNDLQSMMSSILVRGEMFFWMESGASTDVTIRGNRFEGCVMGGGKDAAVLLIKPRMRADFDDKQLFDRNITFEKNTVTAFDNRVIYATSVDGLTLRDNVITRDGRRKSFSPDSPLIDIVNCNDVRVEGNTSEWEGARPLELDAVSGRTAVVIGNNW